MVFVGIFRSKNLAIESPFSLEKVNNFFISAEVVMQKLVSARKAIPNSRMDLNPPIILNHSSTTFLSTLKYTYPAAFSTEFILAFWDFIISYPVYLLYPRLWFLGRRKCTCGGPSGMILVGPSISATVRTAESSPVAAPITAEAPIAAKSSVTASVAAHTAIASVHKIIIHLTS